MPGVMTGQIVMFQYMAMIPLPPEAAAKIQRWYKSSCRRRRFLIMVNKARRKRSYLDQRRKLAYRLHSNEMQIQEMRARLEHPECGAQLVHQYQGARETEAAKRVQTLWRSVKSKKKYVQLVAEQEREKAARKVQLFMRRKLQRRRPNLLSLADRANPCSRPVDADRLMQHEKEILSKRRQYHDAMCGGLKPPDLKVKAQAKYREFADSLCRHRTDIWRMLLHKEQTRQIAQALEPPTSANPASPKFTSPFDRPLPAGISSAAYLRDAEEKHKERMKSMEEELWAVGGADPHVGQTPMAIESKAEEAESTALLRGLEAELGYDFSIDSD